MWLRRAGRACAAATALAALALAGCGGSGSGDQQADVGGPGVGVEVRLADCADWNAADLKERYATVEALRKFAGGPSGSPGGHGATLEDDDAYKLFESYCRNDFASAFKLYRLYTRAAAFRKR